MKYEPKTLYSLIVSDNNIICKVWLRVTGLEKPKQCISKVS